MESTTSQKNDSPLTFEEFAKYMKGKKKPREDFCILMCKKAKGLLENGVSPAKLKQFIKTEFTWYGGENLFLLDEVDTVVDGAYDFVMSECKLPE